MGTANKQIGWSQEANLMWDISKELDQTLKVVGLGISPNNCIVNYGLWKLVKGGAAGDGTVLVDDLEEQEFTFVGPNDQEDNGWVYLKRKFNSDTCLQISYEWTSFDDDSGSIGPPQYDWPIYWTSSTEPTGIPGDLTPRVDATPLDGNWFITVNSGEWFALGIYSDDSCCGRGFLQVQISESSEPCPSTTTTTTTAP